jgi:hypothetical protein
MSIRIAAQTPRICLNLARKSCSGALKPIRPFSTLLSKPNPEHGKPSKIKNPVVIRGFHTSANTRSIFLNMLSYRSPLIPTKTGSVREMVLSILADQWRTLLKECPTKVDLAYGKFQNPSEESLTALLKVLSEKRYPLEDITLPLKGCDKKWLKKLLQLVMKRQPILSGIAACNNAVPFSYPMKYYPNSNLQALPEMEEVMSRSPSILWGYQMQQIPLNDQNIEVLTNHILKLLNGERTITLIFSDKSKSFHIP